LIAVEDILRRKRRRQWSVAEKRPIVAEATQPGTNKSAVAQKLAVILHGGGEVALGLAMLNRASAIHTLIHQRQSAPSCGKLALTAERTDAGASPCASSTPIGRHPQSFTTADIRRSWITTAMWHIAMPVEEPSTAS
jgi:hypothetical protein